MHRYVVLHHTGHGEPHYDLMIGPADGPLVTFRLPAWPVASRVTIEPLPDHRAHYLTYEGPVSGGRGEVRRVEAGDTWVVNPATLRTPGRRDRGLVLQVAEQDGRPVARRLSRHLRLGPDRRTLEPVQNAYQ